jgi:GGDEF domain-containing protein
MLLVCFAPLKEIYHHQYIFTLINFVIVIIGVAISMLYSFWLSNIFVRPIKNLNNAATHMVNGEFDFEIEATSSDEIGELTNTFIETRKVLKSQIYFLENEAFRDGLTRVGNKSAFMNKEAEINKAIKEGQIDFTIVVFDLNRLKAANDIFGHMAGDKLLSTFAKHLADIFDASNVYRLGGDEFAVIIYEDGKTNS